MEYQLRWQAWTTVSRIQERRRTYLKTQDNQPNSLNLGPLPRQREGRNEVSRHALMMRVAFGRPGVELSHRVLAKVIFPCDSSRRSFGTLIKAWDSGSSCEASGRGEHVVAGPQVVVGADSRLIDPPEGREVRR